MTVEARRLLIRGFVQGVGYRDAMCRVARAIGVAGWVRNRGDGDVEAVVEGTPDAIDRIVEWAREGPPDARVDAIEVSREHPSGLRGFERRPSA